MAKFLEKKGLTSSELASLISREERNQIRHLTPNEEELSEVSDTDLQLEKRRKQKKKQAKKKNEDETESDSDLEPLSKIPPP